MMTRQSYQKLAGTLLAVMAVLVIGGGIAIKSLSSQLKQASESAEGPLFEAPVFSLTDENGKSVSNDTLRGAPYVAAFIYTNCTTECPMMTGKMSGLQSKITDSRIKLVSFTVDPERDTPEVLKSYATKFSADTGRWLFLTGTKPQMEAVEAGFKIRLPTQPGATPTTNPLMLHSDRFILVDANGHVRGLFDSKDDAEMAALQTESTRLAGGGK